MSFDEDEFEHLSLTSQWLDKTVSSLLSNAMHVEYHDDIYLMGEWLNFIIAEGMKCGFKDDVLIQKNVMLPTWLSPSSPLLIDCVFWQDAIIVTSIDGWQSWSGWKFYDIVSRHSGSDVHIGQIGTVTYGMVETIEDAHKEIIFRLKRMNVPYFHKNKLHISPLQYDLIMPKKA